MNCCRTKTIRLPAIALAGLLAAAGCGDGGPNCIDVVVTILSPSDGAEISGTGGTTTEIDVTVRVDGLEAGDEVTLTIDGAPHATPATLNANREATFNNVNVDPGNVTLSVAAINECDDEGSDSVSIFVVGDLGCELAIANGTIDTDFYPQPVLNSSIDGDPGTPGFQATIEVQTAPGFRAELFVLDVDQGSEVSAGIEDADGTSGIASFDVTLAQGVQALRAQCVSVGGGSSGAAPAQAFFVDTEDPACAITSPADGANIIPDDDEDPVTDDTQITVSASVTGGDTEGEATTFTIGALSVPGSSVDSQGATSAVATLASPGTKVISVSGQDHALNQCSADIDIDYVTDGCGITITAPAGTVTTDSDGATAGVQLTVSATIDAACVGRTATTSCDSGGTASLDVTVPAGGITDFSVTGCAADTCAVSYNCDVEVTNSSGITTSESLTINIDTEGPGVTVQVTGASGSLPCGAAIGDLDDVDSSLPDTQVDVRVFSPFAATRTLTQNGSPVTLDGIGRARITLADGTNALAGTACDGVGNCDAQNCDITKASLPVNFDAPFANDAILGSDHGTPGSGNLTADVCGTVGAVGASVDLTVTPTVAGADGPATVVGTGWCRTITFPESGPLYQITADATAGPDLGTATVMNIAIDVTPGGPPTGLSLTSVDREAAELSWTAPSDGGGPVAGYIIRYHTAPLDSGNFDTDGIDVLAPVPASPGTPQSAIQSVLRPGETYHFAMASVDAVGNRSAIASEGPIVLDFTDFAVAAPDGAGATQFFGITMGSGDLNNDGVDDLVVGAPGADGFDGVFHVFLGEVGGVPSAPTFTFHSMTPGGFAFFGNEIVVLDWNNDGVDDVAVAAPLAASSRGQVSIFYGGTLFDDSVHPQSRNQSEASVQINSTGQGFLAAGNMGFSMARARFNSDARDDLVLGVPSASSSKGAVIVLLGGGSASSITIDDNDPSMLAGTKQWNILFGSQPGGCSWGTFVFGLGRLDGPGDTRDDIGIGGSVDVAGCTVERAFVVHGRSSDPAGDLATLTLTSASDLVVNVPAGGTGFGEQMASVGDGAGNRTLVIAAKDVGNGNVFLIPGSTTNGALGSPVAASTVATGILQSSTEEDFGSSIANPAGALAADVDGDGFQDLLVAGGTSSPRLFVWYGPSLPTGTVTAEASADHQFDADPAEFGTISTLAWVGDLNADGLDDVCWGDIDAVASPAPGGAEVLY